VVRSPASGSIPNESSGGDSTGRAVAAMRAMSDDRVVRPRDNVEKRPEVTVRL